MTRRAPRAPRADQLTNEELDAMPYLMVDYGDGKITVENTGEGNWDDVLEMVEDGWGCKIQNVRCDGRNDLLDVYEVDYTVGKAWGKGSFTAYR